MAWTLFLDPSPGSPPSMAPMVAGLLLPGTPASPLARSLDAAMRAATSDLPWPPRDEALDSVVGFALASDSLPRIGMTPELVHLLEEVQPFMRGVEMGDRTAVAASRTRLRGDRPDLYKALASRQAGLNRGVRSILRQLFAWEEEGRPLVLMCQACEASAPERTPPELAVVLETAAALLVHRDGPPQPLHVVVGDRLLREPAERHLGPLGVRALCTLLDELGGSPFLSHPELAASLLPVPVLRQYYGRPQTPGALALAHWLGWAAGTVLGPGPSWDLAGQLLDLRLHSGALRRARPSTAPATSLPTMLLSGRCRKRIHTALEGPGQPWSRDLAPPAWAPQATLPWLEAASAGAWR